MRIDLLACLGAIGLLLGCTESAGRGRHEGTERTGQRAETATHAWFQTQRLEGASGARFGWVVALSGATAIVGHRETGIFAYTLSGGRFGEGQELEVDDIVPGWEYGRSAALSGDTAIIGTPGTIEHAAAHIFSRTASGWTKTGAPLTGEPGENDESFGTAVAIDGDLALVGAPYSESVYVFARSGEAWTRQARLRPTVLGGASYFGVAVGISGDLVVVGASREGDNVPFAAGRAYVYTKPSEPSSSWPPAETFVADPRVDYGLFGLSVAVWGDTVLVGASGSGSAGEVYALTKLPSGWSTQKLTVEAVTDWPYPGTSQFGNSVAIAGNRAVVGAPWLATAPQTPSGGVFVLRRIGNRWSEEQVIAGQGLGRYFGQVVSISEGSILVGAPEENARGAAYVERLLGVVGSACDENIECGSGHCVSGVCCDAACDSQCEECPTGACEPRAAGSEGSPSCAPALCDGSRTVCPVACLTNDECVDTFYCLDGSCTAKAVVGRPCSGPEQCLTGHCLAMKCSGTLPNGSSCESATECKRGNCVDGVCCEDACGGQCEACDAEGRCIAVTGEPRADRTPCEGSGTSCDGYCDGKVRDACTYPTSMEDCGTSCEDDTKIVRRCNAQGECIEEEGRPCGQSGEFACDDDALACRSSCEVDDHCAGDLRCWDDETCAPSPRCTSDGRQSETAPGGLLEDCGRYVCNNGRCLTACASREDCAGPNACDPNQRCVAPTAAAGGCGCRTASREGWPAWPIVASLLGLAFTRRARRRAFVDGRS